MVIRNFGETNFEANIYLHTKLESKKLLPFFWLLYLRFASNFASFNIPTVASLARMLLKCLTQYRT